MANDTHHIVVIGADLKTLIPRFFQLIRREIEALRFALLTNDNSKVADIAHTLKGDFGNYGFYDLSDLARELEDAAKSHDVTRSHTSILQIEAYLNTVLVEYR